MAGVGAKAARCPRPPHTPSCVRAGPSPDGTMCTSRSWRAMESPSSRPDLGAPAAALHGSKAAGRGGGCRRGGRVVGAGGADWYSARRRSSAARRASRDRKVARRAGLSRRMVVRAIRRAERAGAAAVAVRPGHRLAARAQHQNVSGALGQRGAVRDRLGQARVVEAAAVEGHRRARQQRQGGAGPQGQAQVGGGSDNGRRSVDWPVAASVASGWNSIGLASTAAKSIGNVVWYSSSTSARTSATGRPRSRPDGG